jgi:hypothetical protein
MVDLGTESPVDRKHLTECIGQFETRKEMEAFMTAEFGLDSYNSGTFLAEKSSIGWDLYRVDGIHTKVVYANGIQGLLGRHLSLGVDHLFKRFSNLTQFTIAHNRSHGGFLDILEAGGDLLGIPSKSALKLASALQARLSGGHAVHLVSHSQGFATTISALRLMASQGTNGTGLTVYPHAGAGNSFHAAALATTLGAKMMPHVFSSFDMVPGIVGMNANPLQVVTGLIGVPSLFGSEDKSAHTLPNAVSTRPWFPWGPGN